ncbi:MAG: hypothetical protein H0W01_09695 [Pseudonocardiales bacterium]|nr:hypothetical protein [Pseudonocardiales bacterium]
MTTTFRTRTAAAALAGARTVLAGCSGGSTTATQTSTAPSTTPASSAAAQPAVTRVELRFAGGSVVGGVGRRAVPLGGTVDLAVSSDVADEVHLHGYDKKVDVPAGGSATVSFVANVSGVFEVELHGVDKLLTRLEVR